MRNTFRYDLRLLFNRTSLRIKYGSTNQSTACLYTRNMSTFNLLQLEKEDNNLDARMIDKYVGNLRQEKKFFALRQHFLMADCDEKGNLTSKDLFVQFLGVMTENQRKYVLLCRNCVDDVEGLLHILLKTNIKKVR